MQAWPAGADASFDGARQGAVGVEAGEDVDADGVRDDALGEAARCCA